jgi:hypothetical protein
MSLTAADVRHVAFSKAPIGKRVTTRTRWMTFSTLLKSHWLG